MSKKLVLIALVFLGGLVHAGVDVQSTSKLGAAIDNADITVEGNRYAYSSANASNRPYFTERAFAMVKLSCDQLYTGSYTGTASVNVVITYKVEENGVYVDKSATQVLKLESDNSKVIDAAYFKAEGAEQIHVVATVVGSFPAGWPQIKLEVSVSTESFSTLSLADITSMQLTHSAALNVDGNLEVQWSPAISNADHYELEWTYVSDQGEKPGDSLTYDKLDIDRFLFRNNSSRVEVSGLSYEIPLMYEKGLILYRLRGVGKRTVNGVVVQSKTEWTAPDAIYGTVQEFVTATAARNGGGAGNVFKFRGLEGNLNWQSSLSFAEEGKHKAVLAYHDGSMRNRQAVTRINTDKRAILGETLYDFNGRPVIQLLPVPVTSNTLNYRPNFNLIEGKNTLQKNDYSVITEGDGCAITSPLFSDTTGASEYYSPNNEFDTLGNIGKNIINRALIPDADKYPYTQTQYTSDNTGRIKAQSGVGEAHQLLSTHETKYLYGAPNQEELTRLFGNQVGYNVHYKKNTTIDPNGQVSVSYMNMGGKVVATGLAGAKPNNVSELSGDKTKTIHTDLFGMDGSTNTLSLDKLNKSYSSKFTVAAKTNYKFDYTAVLGAYDLNCVLDPAHPNTVSLDGAVDLTIQLIDGCGAVVFTENRNTNKGYTGANQSMTMNKAGVQLNQGEYQLTKKLSINEDKLDQYWKEYLANDSLCVRSEKEFIDEEMAKVDTFGCGLTCDQCQKEMQKLLAANPLVSTEEELRILGICDGLCDKTIGCSNYVAAMAGDMSPGGQYAELRKQKVQLDATASASFDDDGNPIVTKPDIKLNNADGAYDAGNPADDVVDATPFPMSILNSSNSLPVPAFLKAAPLSLSSASWKNPIQITVAAFLGYNTHNEVLYATDISFNSATYSITNYKGRDGKIFYVQVIKDGSTYKPAISDASQLILVDANTNLYKIPVKYLSNIADFEKYWQPQWGNYLVPYHPEYGYLLDCYNNYKSYDFDYTLSGTSTLSDAIGKGYLDNVGATTNLLAMDPFTPAGSVNRAYLNASQTDFKSFGTTHYSMIKMANVAANCPRANENLNYCGTTTCGDDKINTTEEWNIYKAFYLSEKQVLIRQRATRRAVNNNYYNGCIGEENFLTTDEAAPFRAYQLVGTTQYSQCRPIWGWSILGYDCSNPIVWTYNTYMPAYLNPNQVCFIDRAPRFKKKTKRFFPMAPASSPAGQMGLHCKKLVSDENGVQEYVSIPCDNDIKSSMDAVITEGQRFKYESCGLCPMASDVESFVMNVMKQKEYSTAPSTHVNCPADKLQLGEVLSRQLTNDNTLNQDMSWTASLSADHKTMTGNIFSGSNTLANFTLNIPNNVRAKLDSLKDFCCLNVDGPNSFSFKATAVSKFSKRDTVFYISGTTSLRIDTCYIPPKCYLTEDSKRVAFFLNSLATRGGDKSSDLNTVGATKNLYGSTFLNAYYSNAVRGVTGYDNDMVQGAYIEDIPATTPKWISTAAGGKLEGTLSYTWNSDVHEVVINISDLLSGYLFEDVVEFSNVRPLSGESQKFYVDAKFVSAQGVEGYDTVIVEVPSLNPVVCKNPVAGKIY